MSDTLPFLQRDYVASFVLATSTQWAGSGSFILPQYALGIETDTGKAKLGDGVTAYSALSYWNPSGGSGTGDVVGPGSSTDNALARFDSTTGKLIQNGTVTEDDSGNLASVGTINGMALPAATGTLGYLNMPQNSQSGDYTTVLSDAGKSLLQTGASKTFTIDSNAHVAYPVGTALTFICTNATGCSIAITADVLTLAGSTTTGTRTLAQNGVATAVKVTSTTWIIGGSGLT